MGCVDAPGHLAHDQYGLFAEITAELD